VLVKGKLTAFKLIISLQDLFRIIYCKYTATVESILGEERFHCDIWSNMAGKQFLRKAAFRELSFSLRENAGRWMEE
jgi:hypothetical protein